MSDTDLIHQLTELITQLKAGSPGPSLDAVEFLMKSKWYTLMGDVRFQTPKGILIAMHLDDGEEKTEWLPRSQCRVVEVDLSDGEGPVLMLQAKAWLIEKEVGKYHVGKRGFVYIPDPGLCVVSDEEAA